MTFLSSSPQNTNTKKRNTKMYPECRLFYYQTHNNHNNISEMLLCIRNEWRMGRVRSMPSTSESAFESVQFTYIATSCLCLSRIVRWLTCFCFLECSFNHWRRWLLLGILWMVLVGVYLHRVNWFWWLATTCDDCKLTYIYILKQLFIIK